MINIGNNAMPSVHDLGRQTTQVPAPIKTFAGGGIVNAVRGFFGRGGVLAPTDFGNDYNTFTAQEAEKARAWSSAQAERQMDFQREMASTQYTRAMQDMRDAGLNPYMLMAGANANASPSGAMATTEQRPIYNSNDTLKRDKMLLDFYSNMMNTVAKMI